MKFAPFNFKSLVRDTAKAYTVEASKQGILLLLAVDAAIPELVIGDMVSGYC
jgi:hypothetical protein